MITAEMPATKKVVSVAEAPDDYLLKPFTSGQLGERLLRLAQKKFSIRSIAKSRPAGWNRRSTWHRHGWRGGPFRADVWRGCWPGLLVELGPQQRGTGDLQSCWKTKVIPWAKLGLARVYSNTRRPRNGKIMQGHRQIERCMSMPDQLAAHLHQEGREKGDGGNGKALKVTPRIWTGCKPGGWRIGSATTKKARQFLEKPLRGGNSTLLDARSVMYLAISCLCRGKQRETDKMLHLLQGLVDRAADYERKYCSAAQAAKCWATQKTGQRRS